MQLIDRKTLYEGQGFVELWKVGYATQEDAETTMAFISEVCRGKKIKNPAKHYKRLLTEHNGEPSELLQFLPQIITNVSIKDANKYHNDLFRFCYKRGDIYYTNQRAWLNFLSTQEEVFEEHDWVKSEEAEDFIVFKIKIPMMIYLHLKRHGMIPNEMAENHQSNRSGHKLDYFSNDEVSVLACAYCGDKFVWDKTTKGRQELLNKGAFSLSYTTGFIGTWLFDDYAWRKFLGVRTKNPSQRETQELARVIYRMLQKHHNYQV